MNDIVWYELKAEIDRELFSHKDVILDWILLPHTHYWKMCDKKILITANEEQRKEIGNFKGDVSCFFGPSN